MTDVAAAAAAPEPTSPVASEPTGGSVLGGPPPNLRELIPAKYQVLAGEELDLQATAAKLASGYSHLHQHLITSGTGLGVPQTPGEYELDPAGFPEGFDLERARQSPEFQQILADLHARGFTNEQTQWALEQVMALNEVDHEAAVESCTEALRAVWPSDREYNQGTRLAVAGLGAFASKAGVNVEAVLAKHGNDPDLVRLFAAIGAEIGEAEPMPTGVNGGGLKDWDAQVAEIREQFKALPKGDPRREALLDRQNALYEARYGTRRVVFTGTGK